MLFRSFPFTHQKAYWVDAISKNLSVDYPGVGFEYQILAEELGDLGKDLAEADLDYVDSAFLESMILPTVRVAHNLNVPLYCSAYGVINQAPTMDTLRWYHDMKMIFDKYYIGRSAWNYKELDFGLMSDRLASCRKEIVSCL